MNEKIEGRTASDIAASVRHLVETGELAPGDMLPPVRQLAEHLDVNRNTVVAAYGELTRARIAVTRGRAGTSIARPVNVPEEGSARDTVLRDVGSGNPAAGLLPDTTNAFKSMNHAPVLYGQSTVDSRLAEWATEWIAADHRRDFRLTVTNGSVDAVERLLAENLTYGDRVAIEDPCFLASINTLNTGGYVPVPVAVDHEGMTVDGLAAALGSGVRALVCTPRAQNPTGASLTATRAKALRRVLSRYKHVLVIEDDHFSLLANTRYHSLIAHTHARWALIRSVSKFLGPDLRVAFVASDATTAERLAVRLSPGTTWVSHLLQRLTFELLSDAQVREGLDDAREHYSHRNALFVKYLRARGLAAAAADGLNVWVDTQTVGVTVTDQLMRRGWLARSGEIFSFGTSDANRFVRLTVHDLADEDMNRLVDDLIAAVVSAKTSVPQGAPR